MDRRTFVKAIAAGGAAIMHGAGAPAAGAPLGKAAQQKLSEHRIAKMETRRLGDRYPRFVGRNARGRPCGRGGGYQIRILVTDQGARGWAMSYAPHEQVKHLIGARVGDIFDVEHGPAEDAYLIEKPLHDLAGNILGVPAHALMGSKGPKKVPIYSGAVYFDDLEPEGKPRGVPGVLASCQQDYDAGYRAFKLKMGRGFKWIQPKKDGIRRDIEVTRAVREKFPDCTILVDANDGYTVDDFLTYVSGVADCGLAYIEEPFQEHRDGLKRLKDHMAKVGCKALIMDGERRTERARPLWKYGGYTRRHVDNLLALAKEKLVDVLNLDLGIVGFTRWRKVMPELEKLGVSTSPHTWMWIPRPFYAAQLAAGMGNVCIVEGIPGTTRGVDYSAYTFDKNGDLVLPDAPGFGLTLTS